MQTAATKMTANVPGTRGKGLSFTLWTLQALLALLFVFSGLMKFMTPAEQLTKGTSLPISFIYFIGVCEVLGGIGLVVPALLRILPILTPIAASGLVIIMAGATVISMPKGVFAIVPLVIGLMAAFVAYGRFRLKLIHPRTSS